MLEYFDSFEESDNTSEERNSQHFANMEAHIRVLNDLKNQIEKSLVNFRKSPKQRITLCYIETRLEDLETQYAAFRQKHEDAISEIDPTIFKASTYLKEGVFDLVSEKYIDCKTELKSAASKLKEEQNVGDRLSPPVKSTAKDSLVKLPKITIPVFSGKYNEWPSFRDLFVSLVHKNSVLDDVQKLHYLKTQLTGEAEQLIKHVTISQANYVKCWDLLQNRYNNKRFMSNCILKRLFSQRNIISESSNALKELLDTTNDCLHELSNLGIDVESWDVIVIYIASSKLDAESRKQWELQASKSSDDLPTFNNFKEFLETRFRALEFIEPKGKPKVTSNTPVNHKVMHVTTGISCPFCSGDHKLHNCKNFANEDVDERRAVVQKLNLCFNCLGGNPSVKSCRLFVKCRICKRKHHSLLHPKGNAVGTTDNSVAVVHTPTASKQDGVVNNIATHFLKGNLQTRVLLATALIKAESDDGHSQVLRALVDQGSQASFISEAAVQLLRLKRIATKSSISGLGGDRGGLTSKYMVTVNIQSLHDPNFKMRVRAHVLGTLTSVLPETKTLLSNWPELQGVTLADPQYSTPNKIDVLLGAEVYCHILKGGLIKGPQGCPMAQDTYLGWIVSGEVEVSDDLPINCHNVIVSMQTQVEENDVLKKFWELESDDSCNKKKLFTPEEQACEDHFAKTVRRDSTGHFVVSLPFRQEDPMCKYGNSKAIALKRFSSLERRLERYPDQKADYTKVIHEYIKLGHMEKISEEDLNKPDAVYLPHHAVIREDKTTTKTRVVFDASSKGTNGVSLNDTLMVGPTLQDDLRHIVMRWRQHPICLAADIVKMYRQVKVVDPHTDYQRIVWRDDKHSEMEEYRLLTVTFGTSCAPYLAVKALQQTSIDESQAYSLAAGRVLTDFYVDDLMTGCNSEAEAVSLYQEFNELLKKGGFELQKWTCNKEEVLETLQGKEGRDLEIKMDRVTKVLGLTWNRSTDEFSYTVNPTLMSATGSETKRTVISKISRLYDPLGWLAPCIITSKIFIQKLWLAGLEWDEELPPELLKEWENYQRELSELANFHLPRWLQMKNDVATVELHGFSDASNVAYSAVVYTRVIDSEGNIHTNLVTAKTKVAPVKQVSIPRLELCGAVLLTRILNEVAQVIGVPKSSIHAWTDSTVVLSWLRDNPSRWKTFVANRTSEILSVLDSTQWSHIPSQDNPADCASRGIAPRELLNNQLWKDGPSRLRERDIQYTKPVSALTQIEAKTVKVHATLQSSDQDDFFTRFSSLLRMIRVVAFCRRMLRLKQTHETRTTLTPHLTAPEIAESLDSCIRRCQHQWFSEEFKGIEKNSCVQARSSLASLSPFVDDKGLLRVGGRIDNSSLPADRKHPIIIPHESHLAKLIVADAHEKTFHGGPQLMLNYLRSRYWIPRAKNLIKAWVRRCVPCVRHAAASNNPMMGQMPACRVTPSKPFLHSGVDYAGPINIRVSKGRGHRSYKGYICLFVCMSTRTVHIEVVSELTSQGFLSAFKRFVARRGHCSDLWSDNGTNFVGASRELKVMFSDERSSMANEVASVLANNGTEWHFIPPHAPNFGGLWEAGIKSVKHHLKRVIGDSTLTYEEMATVLSQIEACLNSRPLSQASSDPQDPAPLTPGHFIVGQPLVIAPDYNYEESQMGSLRRWQLTQRMVQSFWRRWSHEYLTNFFQRYKWATRTNEPSIGDVVLVKEDNLPPAKWLYGRVVQIHPGKDAITRVVTLRCKNSLMKRPTSKLCIFTHI